MNFESLISNGGPLLLAALGGLLSEWAGMLNIGLEGFMLVGAFLAIAGAHNSGSWQIGLLFGCALACLGGLLLGWLMSWAAIKRKANIFIVGLAINILASSLVSFGGSWLLGTRSVVALADHQLVPTVTSDIITGVGSLLIALIIWVFSRSSLNGLRLRVVGSDAPMLIARGIDATGLSQGAIIVSAVLASLAGALLSIQLGAFVPNQSSGMGWIALVLVFVGRRHPLGIVAACAIYVVVAQLSINAQAGMAHPALMVGLPYLLVFAALVLAQTGQQLFKLRRK